MRAPVAGRLSGFDMAIGQNVPRGERLGQVSDPKAFKLVANIDEYYLGQLASFERAKRNYSLQIAKIYPDVKNGQFQVDLKIVGDTPVDLRRGQTIHPEHKPLFAILGIAVYHSS